MGGWTACSCEPSRKCLSRRELLAQGHPRAVTHRWQCIKAGPPQSKGPFQLQTSPCAWPRQPATGFACQLDYSLCTLLPPYSPLKRSWSNWEKQRIEWYLYRLGRGGNMELLINRYKVSVMSNVRDLLYNSLWSAQQRACDQDHCTVYKKCEGSKLMWFSYHNKKSKRKAGKWVFLQGNAWKCLI